jgi:NAD+ kinase
VLEADFRPQSVTADNIEFRDIASALITQDDSITIPLLHDEGHGLSKRIISEQFTA